MYIICAFVDDIIVIDETIEGANIRLEQWRHILESRALKKSRLKTKYLCSFMEPKRTTEKSPTHH